MIRSSFRLLVLALTAALAALVVGVPAQAAAPYCGITWGSLAKAGPSASPVPAATVGAVRAGRHDCYDRLVLDVRGVTSLRTWRGGEGPARAQGPAPPPGAPPGRAPPPPPRRARPG